MIRFVLVAGLVALILAGCASPSPVPPEAEEPAAAEEPPASEEPTSTPEPAAEPTATPEPTPTPSAYDTFKAVAGEWTGSWTNTTFGSTGSAGATITINPDGTASYVLDLGGLVFGLIDPPPKEFAGTYDSSGATFQVQDDDLFGDVTITVSADGAISFGGTDVPVPGIDSVSAEGTITAQAVEMSYTVTFSGGGTAEGVMSMTPT